MENNKPRLKNDNYVIHLGASPGIDNGEALFQKFREQLEFMLPWEIQEGADGDTLLVVGEKPSRANLENLADFNVIFTVKAAKNLPSYRRMAIIDTDCEATLVSGRIYIVAAKIRQIIEAYES